VRHVALWTTAAAVAAAAAGTTTAAYLGLVTAAIPIDLGIGRRHQALGPLAVDIAAPRDLVFDILAAPYLGRQTRAMADKIHILERGSDMVLAAHRTPIGRRLAATTVETVRFTRPERVDFRLVRGPVPEVTEQFLLSESVGDQPGTRLEYQGRLGTDLWVVGAWWGRGVAGRWQGVVADTFAAVKTEAERRSHAR
jgi:hypothetical protein